MAEPMTTEHKPHKERTGFARDVWLTAAAIGTARGRGNGDASAEWIEFEEALSGLEEQYEERVAERDRWKQIAKEIQQYKDAKDDELLSLEEQLQSAEEAAQRNWDEHGDRMAKAIDAERVGMKALRDALESTQEQYERVRQRNVELETEELSQALNVRDTEMERLKEQYQSQVGLSTVAVSRLGLAEAKLKEAQEQIQSLEHRLEQSVPALHREQVARRELQEQLEALRTALEFYADEKTYTQMTSWGGRIIDQEGPWLSDTGRRAREVLYPASEPKP